MSFLKKIICAFLITFTLISPAVGMAASAPCFEIDYTDPKSNAIDMIAESGSVNYWVKNKSLHVDSKMSSDGTCEPYILLNVDIPDASKACWLKICIKNNSSSPKLRFGFGESEITGASCSLLDISVNDSGYKTYIADMTVINEETLPLSSMFGLCDPSVTESVWEGKIDKFRIGLFFTDFPGDSTPENLNAEIAYIGFFETKDGAESHYVKLPSSPADRSKVLATICIIALIIILVIAFLRYGSKSGNGGKKKTKKKGRK